MTALMLRVRFQLPAKAWAAASASAWVWKWATWGHSPVSQTQEGARGQRMWGPAQYRKCGLIAAAPCAPVPPRPKSWVGRVLRITQDGTRAP